MYEMYDQETHKNQHSFWHLNQQLTTIALVHICLRMKAGITREFDNKSVLVQVWPTSA